MPNFNRWIGMGNLTRDPEQRRVGETSVTRFALAVNRDYTDRSRQRDKETLFIDCEAWGARGDTIHRNLRKGEPLFVEGRLKLDQWEKDGHKHSRIVCVVENFQFLGGRRALAGRGGEDEHDDAATESRGGGRWPEGERRRLPNDGEAAPRRDEPDDSEPF